MAPRRSAARGGGATRGNTRQAPSAIRKNTRSRQPPSRYGQESRTASIGLGSEITNEPRSESDEVNPSTTDYTPSPRANSRPHNTTPASPNSILTETATLAIPSERSTQRGSADSPAPSINIHTMRELLRSHEQDIIDRVVHQLNSQHPHTVTPTRPSPQIPFRTLNGAQPPPTNPILSKIEELEKQLAQLRAATASNIIPPELGAHGTSNPLHSTILQESESASASVESVETLFPGVERSTLVQIIENRFKPTNIYRLLANEKERAETNHMINIGGIEFEQTERDGKESEYRMSNFFKAWAAYSGILTKLAPYGLQGELTTALFIYTMNLYDLLEKYTWEGVKAYHFQFHRKRVASGKNLYQPSEWRQLGSQLIASKGFAHPALRSTWNQTPKTTALQTRRIFVLPIRENQPGAAYTNPSTFYPPGDRRTRYPPSTMHYTNPPAASIAHPPNMPQPCRNWNYRECTIAPCRDQHSCITCGNSHRASQCLNGNSKSSNALRNNQHRPLSNDNFILTATQAFPPPTNHALNTSPPHSILNGPTISQGPARPNTFLHYPLFTPHTIPMPPCPLKIQTWKRLTSEYPDPAVTTAVIGICQYGARIGYHGPRELTTIHPNLSTAMTDTTIVSLDIARELTQNRLQAFTREASLPPGYTASPLGLVHKADGSKRGIHHLSYPIHGETSINSRIPAEYGTIAYSSINDAIHAVQTWGRDCIHVKRDFESAFRHIPICPLDSPLVGFQWQSVYYTECFLPFGLRTAPYLFNLFAEVFHWVLENQFTMQNIRGTVIHYLDDFFLVLPPGSDSQRPITIFATLCQELGLSIKESKSEERYIASFAGIEIDTRRMVIRLPSNKLLKARTIVQSAMQQKSLPLVDLQRITGYLNFVSTVVPFGCTFLRRLYDMKLYFPPGNGHERRRVSSEARKDLIWWAEILAGTPKRSISRKERDIIYTWTDAASTRGLGAFYMTALQTSAQPSSSFAISLPTGRKHPREHINTLEMQAVEQALLYWGQRWKGKHVVLNIDNQAVAYRLAKGTMRGMSMDALRRCLLLATEYDLELETHWIPTDQNCLAYAPSRLDYPKIANLARQLLYPSCNLETRGLLTFSNRASQRQQPIFSGGDSHPAPGAITTPQGPALRSSALSPTTNIRAVDAFLLEQHGSSSGFAP